MPELQHASSGKSGGAAADAKKTFDERRLLVKRAKLAVRGDATALDSVWGDADVREAVADRQVDVGALRAAA